MSDYEINTSNPLVPHKVEDVTIVDLESTKADFVKFVRNGEIILALLRSSIQAIRNTTPDTNALKGIGDVLDALVEVVTEFGPGYVYPRERANNCAYLHFGAPDCIAAKVLRKLGVSLDELGNRESQTCETFNGLGISDDGLKVLRWAQYAQDTGNTWGDALIAAVRKAHQMGFEYEIPEHLPQLHEVTNPDGIQSLFGSTD